MAWGFRRSVSFGGVRFTFSKSGVSTSVGGTGFRVTSGPRGVYVTSGFGGFYYRQRIDQPPERHSSPQQPPGNPDYTFSVPTTYFTSADVSRLSDSTQEGFVNQLSEVTRAGALPWVVAAIGLIAVSVAAQIDATYAMATAVPAIAAAVWALARDNKRRRFLLVYDLDEGSRSWADAIYSAVGRLANSGFLQGVDSESTHGDWKRNAGTTTSVATSSFRIISGPPPHVASNIDLEGFAAQGKELYFLPDRVLIRQGSSYAALEYSSISGAVSVGRFVLDRDAPPGARVLGWTWRYVRRNGGPDRRFANNVQLPIIQVAYLDVTSATGLHIRVITSDVDAASIFVNVLNARNATRRTASVPPPTAATDARYTPAVVQALSALGLAKIPPAPELQRLYHDLASRNHPDKFASAAPDVRALAEERMREINGAYAVLKEAAATAAA